MLLEVGSPKGDMAGRSLEPFSVGKADMDDSRTILVYMDDECWSGFWLLGINVLPLGWTANV